MSASFLLMFALHSLPGDWHALVAAICVVLATSVCYRFDRLLSGLVLFLNIWHAWFQWKNHNSMDSPLITVIFHRQWIYGANWASCHVIATCRLTFEWTYPRLAAFAIGSRARNSWPRKSTQVPVFWLHPQCLCSDLLARGHQDWQGCSGELLLSCWCPFRSHCWLVMIRPSCWRWPMGRVALSVGCIAGVWSPFASNCIARRGTQSTFLVARPCKHCPRCSTRSNSTRTLSPTVRPHWTQQCNNCNGKGVQL